MADDQNTLFANEPQVDAVMGILRELARSHAQPSAWELLQHLDNKVDLKARWAVEDAIRRLMKDSDLTTATRDYFRDLLESGDLAKALRGKARPGREIESSIDALVRASTVYRSSTAFQEMVDFMANFRDYAPFNNMLVRLQNPSCSFYASRRDWERRFSRAPIEDARPMLILATMHPVMLVYDVDQTGGKPLPEELRNFAKFEGEWNPKQLDQTVENAMERDRIRIDFKRLSSTNAGFATLALGSGESKMRIAIHEELDLPSRFGVVCHELAHVYLGHLGGDKDGWWPSRGDLNHRAMEIEAEAVAHVVTQRAGLSGASSRYVSRYLQGDKPMEAVSIDLIAKVSGRIEEMAKRRQAKRRTRDRKAVTE